MSQSRFARAVGALAAFAVCPGVLAEEPQRIEEVVVTGAREATPLAATPAAIGRLETRALDDAKATRIDQAINALPGVHMVDLGNEQHSMSIRQPITTNAVYQYLEDGVPIRPVGVFNHNALNEVNLTGAGEVEVIRGPASSLYGSNAVGGAVNFLTRAPSPTPEGRLSLLAGSEGYNRVDTGASNTWGDFGLRLAHYSARQRASWRGYNDMDKDSLTLRADHALDAHTPLKLVYSYNELDTETPGSLNETDYRNNPAVSYQTFSYRRDKSQRLSATLERERGGVLNALTLYARENDHGQNPAYSIRSCTVSATCPTGYSGNINLNSYTSLGFEARQRRNLGGRDARLIVGLTFDRSPNSYLEDKINVTRDAANVYTGYTLSTRNREYEVLLQNAALYAQYEFTLLPRTRLALGGRYDALRYDYTNKLTPSSTTGAPDESRTFDHFSPKLGLTHELSPATSLYVAYSQGFTPPEVSSLYARLAVPNLKSAVFDNYEAGVRSRFAGGRGRVNASLYRLEGYDEQVSYTIAVGNSEPRNAGRTRHTGVELGLDYAFSDRWEGRLAGTLAEHKYLDYDASSTLNYDGKIAKQAPQQIVNAELAWKPAAGWRVAIEVMRLGPYWMNDANTVLYGGHSVFNLRAGWARGAWELWGKLINLTDRKYSTSASSSYSGTGSYSPDTHNTYTPGDPRTLFVGMAYRFGAAAR
jgi:outer membrane receptor protein involved in Fe transport